MPPGDRRVQEEASHQMDYETQDICETWELHCPEGMNPDDWEDHYMELSHLRSEVNGFLKYQREMWAQGVSICGYQGETEELDVENIPQDRKVMREGIHEMMPRGDDENPRKGGKHGKGNLPLGQAPRQEVMSTPRPTAMIRCLRVQPYPTRAMLSSIEDVQRATSTSMSASGTENMEEIGQALEEGHERNVSEAPTMGSRPCAAESEPLNAFEEDEILEMIHDEVFEEKDEEKVARQAGVVTSKDYWRSDADGPVTSSEERQGPRLDVFEKDGVVTIPEVKIVKEPQHGMRPYGKGQRENYETWPKGAMMAKGKAKEDWMRYREEFLMEFPPPISTSSSSDPTSSSLSTAAASTTRPADGDDSKDMSPKKLRKKGRMMMR